jgi:hypothetical protein
MKTYEGVERRNTCTERRDVPWHLNKFLSVGMIAALVSNSAALVWYASKFDSRLFAVETKTTEIVEWRERADEQRTKIEIKLGEVSQHVSDNTKILDHILQILENNRKQQNAR